RGAAHHGSAQASPALPRGPEDPRRGRALGLRGPRGPDRGDREAGARSEAPPELRPARGDDLALPVEHAGSGAAPSVGRYLLRRLAHLGPVLLGVSLIVFLVLHLTPGDPAEVMLGSQATQEDLSRLRTQLGLDRPLHIQYLHWIGRVLQGDLGRSLW